MSMMMKIELKYNKLAKLIRQPTEVDCFWHKIVFQQDITHA